MTTTEAIEILWDLQTQVGSGNSTFGDLAEHVAHLARRSEVAEKMLMRESSTVATLRAELAALSDGSDLHGNSRSEPC